MALFNKLITILLYNSLCPDPMICSETRQKMHFSTWHRQLILSCAWDHDKQRCRHPATLWFDSETWLLCANNFVRSKFRWYHILSLSFNFFFFTAFYILVVEETLLLSSLHTLVGKGREVDFDLNTYLLKKYKFSSLFDGVLHD